MLNQLSFNELINPSFYDEGQNIDILESFLKEENSAYRKGDEETESGFPAISDSRYDMLVRILEKYKPESEFLQSIEQEEIFGEVYEHKSRMLSTQKAFSIEDKEKFLTRCEEQAKEIGIKNTLIFKVTPKLDGMAAQIEDGVMATRGDGYYGTNISHLLKKITINADKNNDVGELVIKKSYFNEHFADEFDHVRNFGNGIVTSEKDDEKAVHRKKVFNDKAIELVSYKTLPKWMGTKNDLMKDLDSILEKLEEETDYAVDGFVVEAINENLKKYMGHTNKYHKWMCAFKTVGEIVTEEVKDVFYQVGRTGNVTPVAIINPTLISGAYVSRCTAHNARLALELGIGKGAIVEFIRSGEVIPKIENVTKKGTVVLPTSCPSCGGELTLGKTYLTCNNKTSCPAQSEGRILHFFSKLPKCNGFGPKVAEKLVEAGYEDVSDILNLKQGDFIEAGISSGVAKNLEESLNVTKTHKIKNWKLLSAFGIQYLGEGNSKRLFEEKTIYEIVELTQKEILNIENFGDITSEIVFNELQNHKSDILKIFNDGGFNVVEDEVEKDSPVFGKKILFTGTMIYNGEKVNRDDLTQEMLSKGGKKGTVSRNLDILVVGEKAGSKLTKAEKLNSEGCNIKIMDINEYMEFLNE